MRQRVTAAFAAVVLAGSGALAQQPKVDLAALPAQIKSLDWKSVDWSAVCASGPGACADAAGCDAG
jgi:hypothetical protein